MSLEKIFEFDYEHEFKNLDEFMEYLNTKQFPTHFQKSLIHINTPIQVRYINDKQSFPLCDENIMVIEKEFINGVTLHHLNTRNEFYSGIKHKGESKKREIEMFADSQIQFQYNLSENKSIIIQEPKIIITSERKVGFTTIYDRTTFSQNKQKLN